MIARNTSFLRTICEKFFLFQCLVSSNYDLEHLVVEAVGVDAEWWYKEVVINGKRYRIPQFLYKAIKLIGVDGNEVLLLFCSDQIPMPDITHPDFISKHPKTILIYGDIQEATIFPFMELLHLSWKPKTVIRLYFFYSFTDIEAFFVDKVLLGRWLAGGVITKKRNISGILPGSLDRPEFKLFDLYGAFNTSLDKSFEMVGMETDGKHLPMIWAKGKLGEGTSSGVAKNYAMTHFKEFCIAEPLNGVIYSAGDTELKPLWEKRVEMIKELILESLDFSLDINDTTCPRSAGSLLSLVTNEWLSNIHPALPIALNTLFLPSSKTKPMYKAFMSAVAEWNPQGYDKRNPFEFYIPAKNKKGTFIPTPIDTKHPEYNFKLYGGDDNIAGMSCASIRTFGSMTDSTACFNGVVQGGRCINERPDTKYWYNVLDYDLSSCYGTSLEGFIMPMGRPTIWSAARDTPKKLLGDLLDEIGDDLLDNLYQIIIDTPEGHKMSLVQDIIFSKLKVSEKSIRDNLTKPEDRGFESDHIPGERDVAAAHITGDFTMLTKEIRLGVITSDNLAIIRAVSTEQEWKDWMGMHVVTAAYYPKSQEVTVDELVEELCHNPGSVTTFEGRVVDNRSRKWAGVPLKGFIGNFVTARKGMKKQSASKGDSHDLKQNGMKLFINTTYGDLASPYFAMGNAIIANNITAKARAEVWMVSKALGAAQSITDGGLYSNDGVRFLELSENNQRKPGFTTFADSDTLEKHRNIRVGKLIDYEAYMSQYQDFVKRGMFKELKTLNDNLDAVVTTHINNFWSHYGLKLSFKIEHKYGNTCRLALTDGSSNYILDDPLVPDTECFGGIPVVIKCRGARELDHPKRIWMLVQIGRVPVSEYDSRRIDYDTEHSIGIPEWVLSNRGNNMPAEILPHYGEWRTTTHIPNLDHAHTTTIQVHNNREDRAKKNAKAYKDKVKGGDTTTRYGMGVYIDDLARFRLETAKEVKRLENL